MKTIPLEWSITLLMSLLSECHSKDGSNLLIEYDLEHFKIGDVPINFSAISKSIGFVTMSNASFDVAIAYLLNIVELIFVAINSLQLNIFAGLIFKV